MGFGMSKIRFVYLSVIKKIKIMENVLYQIKKSYPDLTIEIFKSFIDTHYTDFILNPDWDMIEEFKEWYYVNC